MATRDISLRGDGSEPALDRELHKLLLSELIAPSKPFWIVSAWLSDVDLIDNRGGELLELAPALPVRSLRLIELLAYQVSVGAEINVVVRDVSHNRPVLRRLEEVRGRSTSGVLRLATMEDLHEKVLLSSRLMVSGSMNLTHNGRLKNTEHVTFTTDTNTIERQRLSLEQLYGGALSCR